MQAWRAMLAVIAAACGGSGETHGPLLAPAEELLLVAHAGDDLWFLQPEVSTAVQRGAGATVVYVTAGETPSTVRDVGVQMEALQTAYSTLIGDDAWQCGPVTLGPATVEHCRLGAHGLSLIFVGYPGGGPDGAATDSLLHLWQDDIATATTLLERSTALDRAQLIALVAALIDATAPATLRTHEIAATHGRDHSDHMLVGALAVLATAASTASPQLIAYRGDNIADAPANNDPRFTDRSLDAAARYAACATGCAPCGTACTRDQLPGERLAWLARRYPTAMRPSGEGVLRQDAGCAAATTEGANPTMVPCAGAPRWQLEASGRLRASTGLCLRALFTGELVATACGEDGPGGRFWLDDEGHVWSGMPPLPAADMAYAHLDCLVVSGGRPRTALCGEGRAPIWQLE